MKSKVGPVSVALSGSGFRFMAHIGAMQAILDAEYTITEIAGTSGGSIVAAFYAAGYTVADMKEIAISTPLSQLFGISLWSLFKNHTLDSGISLLNWLSKYLSNTSFKETIIPLHIVSTDLNANGAFVFDTDNTIAANLAIACRASSSIPFVYPAVIYEDTYLVDGGLCSDLPANYLDPSANKIAIELYEADPILNVQSSTEDMVTRLTDTILYLTEEEQLAKVKSCTLVKVITPYGLSLKSNLTQADLANLYQIGYDTTKEILNGP